MRAVGVEELRHLPFVRHQLDPALVRGAWVSGEAAVVAGGRRMADGLRHVVTAFGPLAEVGPLLAEVARQVEPPHRMSLPLGGDAVAPPGWELGPTHHWHWMLSRTPVTEPTVEVVEVTDPGEVNTLLDVAAPDSHARPGTPGIEAWLGIREAGRLVAVGAVVRQPDGTGHLRAVAVAPDARGRGLGRELSIAMTRRAQAGTGIASLGVYVDNEPALRIYRALGYEVVHSFTSGSVSGRSMTTAVDPSR